MSQKSSLPQPTKSVSRVLAADTAHTPSRTSVAAKWTGRKSRTRLLMMSLEKIAPLSDDPAFRLLTVARA